MAANLNITPQSGIMKKLHRIKSPCLKRIVIGLGLIAAVEAGYQLNETKWQRLLQKQPPKTTQNLTQTAFRMDEYTPEGVKIADLNAIDNLPFTNPDSAKFSAYQIDSLTVDSLKAIGKRKDNNGHKLADILSFPEIERRKNQLAAQQDTVYSETYLKSSRQYYDLVCLEIYKCGRNGENADLWQKNDEELRREVMLGQHLIKVKMEVLKNMQRSTAYPVKEFERDFRRMRMAQSLHQEHLIRRENNKACAYLMAAREGEFLAAHQQKQAALRTALYDKAKAQGRASLDSLMQPFKYMVPKVWDAGRSRGLGE